MRSTIRKGLVASAVVAAGIGLTATPALAATWTVTGADPSGEAFAESSNTSLEIVRNGAVLTCDLVEVEANIENTAGHSGLSIGQILASDWISCTGPLNLTFGVSQVGTWDIDALAATSDPDVSTGAVTGVQASISGPGCSATFTGGAPGSYDNSTGTLTLDPNGANPGNAELTASNVTGCLGIITNGDKGLFSGDFSVDPAVQLTTP